MTPPPRKGFLASSSEWLAHARSDLAFARLGLNQDILPEQICFHAQQAVEKALKAVLLHEGIDFPFTHDLEALLDTLSTAGIEVPDELQDVGALTPYAVETRYPGFWGEIGEAEVREAIGLADKVLTWAGNRLA
ncbi:HEPN domain-containing protein [Geobacter sp.]|uniref:HEPN domain-containing protein n=1 Tax=Geobacter sp. TaxID=46610 RepID=UPI0026258518|nr:HEPN domain-containing protein [Geobacter sp.]